MERVKEKGKQVRQRARMRLEDLKAMAKERPYVLTVMQTQILYDIASMLEDQGKEIIDLRQDFNKLVPKGVFRPLTKEITDQPIVLENKNTPSMPWISCTIFNDGDDPVYPKVNEDEGQTHTPIYKGEPLEINMGKDQIHKIVLQCTSGQTSTVRIFAIK